MATPWPTQRSIGTSLGMSPNATMSSALISSGRATSSRPAALLIPIELISMRPSLVEYVMSPSTPTCRASAAANSELGVPGLRTSSLTAGALSRSS